MGIAERELKAAVLKIFSGSYTAHEEVPRDL